MSGIDQITIKDGTSLEDIVSVFHQYGGVCFPAYVNADEVAALNREFARLHQDDANTIDHVSCVNGRHTRALRQKLEAASCYPHLCSVLSDQWIGKIALAYMSSFGCFNTGRLKLWEQLEIEHNQTQGRSNNSAWHFDRVPSVKASLYLHDTDENSGAYSLIPGSHNTARLLARSQLREDPNPLNLSNFVRDDDRLPVMEIAAPAGTITIFDTLTVHRGGYVAEGNERRNIRLITFARPLSGTYLESGDIDPGANLDFMETYFSSDNQYGQDYPGQYQYREKLSIWERLGGLFN